MPDELFTPTIQDRRPVSGKAPWNPQSIIYPAFFGGPLAAATLGVLNGRRLGLGSGRLLGIAGAGLVAIAARIAVTAAIDGNSGVRLAGSLAGVLVWLVVLAWQRQPFRAFEFADGEPASLVWPGIAAFLGCGLLEALIIFVLVR